MNIWIKILLLPFIPIVFAYLELGGNWFGLRLLQKQPTLWSASGTIIFSVLYSIVSAYVAIKLQLDLGLLMVAYGFGFSIVAIFMRLDWGELPEFSTELVKQHPLLWLIAAIAVIGFVVSSYLLLTTKVTR